tara:strand:+ start:30 stop:995 length:966 start_codon:yes stop_codon:yes gene_type:complete
MKLRLVLLLLLVGVTVLALLAWGKHQAVADILGVSLQTLRILFLLTSVFAVPAAGAAAALTFWKILHPSTKWGQSHSTVDNQIELWTGLLIGLAGLLLALAGYVWVNHEMATFIHSEKAMLVDWGEARADSEVAAMATAEARATSQALSTQRAEATATAAARYDEVQADAKAVFLATVAAEFTPTVTDPTPTVVPLPTPTPRPAPTPPPTAPPREPNCETFRTFTGTIGIPGMQRTKAFFVHHQWRIRWTYTEYIEGGYILINVYPADGGSSWSHMFVSPDQGFTQWTGETKVLEPGWYNIGTQTTGKFELELSYWEHRCP